MKKKLIATIALASSFFCASAQWTASGNNTYNTQQGKVSIGTTNLPAKLTVFESTLLGSAAKNSTLLTSISGSTANNFQHNTWLVRNAAGTDWFSARLHDGISVDGSFLAPQVDTKTWWERDPFQDIQSWGTAGNTYFTMREGKFGIGTKTPSATLSVSGSGSTNQHGLNSIVDVYAELVNDRSRISIGNTSNTSTSASVVFYGKNAANSALEAKWEIGTDLNLNHARDMYFYNTNISQVQLFLHGDGNVGIGTTSPTEKLSINGTIRSKAIKVEASPWPDFVFKPTYQLRPLSEVKSYIDKYQHLPEVPSATEVEKDGLNLGEMNALLMKKVEELTLYLIQKDKQIEQQKLTNADILKRLSELEKLRK